MPNITLNLNVSKIEYNIAASGYREKIEKYKICLFFGGQGLRSEISSYLSFHTEPSIFKLLGTVRPCQRG